VSFTDLSSDADGSIAAWEWDFGDGHSSAEQNPAYTYAASDTYSVTLTVTDSITATDATTQQVTVTAINLAPTADFSYAANELEVTFTDLSSDADGSVVGWRWDFGDSNSSTEQNPVHTYAASDTYSVTLTVTDNITATDTTAQQVTVTSTNLAPTATFTYTVSGPAVTFTDLSSDADGSITGWSWDFGDGNGSVEQNPVHTYAASDTYTVTLTATDNDAATHAASQQVPVTAANLAPTADFSYAANGLEVTFSDLSSDLDGSMVGWSWDFGDGNSSTEQNPVYTYAASDSYSVTLTASDDDAATDTITQQVTVTAANLAPTASFSYTVAALQVTFSDLSSDPDGSVVAWAWEFGDGGTDSGQNPSHIYGVASSYPVTLTVTDDGGATAEASQQVTVSDDGVDTEMYIADLQGTSSSNRNKWRSEVTIWVADEDGAAVADAEVAG